MPHGMKIGIGTGHTVLDGDPAPAERDSAPAPHFSAHVCCGQRAKWIKMPLGTEVGPGQATLLSHGSMLK